MVQSINGEGPRDAGEVPQTGGVASSPFPSPPGPSRFAVRKPKIRDVKNFTNAVALADLSPDTARVAANGENEAAMLMMLRDAIASPAALDQMMGCFADLWEWEPPADALTAEEPPENWEYDPPSDLVESGNAIGRDERWRSLSKRQKKRLVKKLALEDEGIEAIGEFWEAIKELPYIKDFTGRSGSAGQEDTGSSSTPSAPATAGTRS